MVFEHRDLVTLIQCDHVALATTVVVWESSLQERENYVLMLFLEQQKNPYFQSEFHVSVILCTLAVTK